MQIGFALLTLDEDDFPSAMRQLECLTRAFTVQPIVSPAIVSYRGKYGDGDEIMQEMQRICDQRVLIVDLQT